MTDPAFVIPLTADHLALIGEITVIIGQADEQMVRTVSGLIQGDRKTTDLVMGSTNVKPRAEIWAALIKLRCDNPDIIRYTDWAAKEIGEVAGERNHFIHSDWVFTPDLAELFGAKMPTRRLLHTDKTSDYWVPVSVKVQNTNSRKFASALKPLRDRAAILSCVIAHIGWCLAPHGRDNPQASPWIDRLPELHPQQSNTGKPRKRGLKPKPQRGSSPQ